MQYHDPARPSRDSRPLYYSHEGRFCSPLPNLNLYPNPDRTFSVWISLRQDGDSFLRLCHTTNARGLEVLALDWRDAPEQAMRKYWGYELATSLPLPPKPEPIGHWGDPVRSGDKPKVAFSLDNVEI